MFRIIVISLFVANVLLLAFEASKPQVQKSPATPLIEPGKSDIPTIHLFSELMENRDLMSGNRQCFSLGPFHDVQDMLEVSGRLQEVSLSTFERETQALVEKGYWVFLRPYSTLLEANEVLFALQALGLEDIGVIYDGDLKKSISLGYFLRQENAMKRKQGLEAKGYEPLMRVQRHTEPRYWLDYEQNPGSSLIALDMQSRPNDFMQRAMPCAEKPQIGASTLATGPLVEGELALQTDTVDEGDITQPEDG